MPRLPETIPGRLAAQLTFLLELDRLKTVLRQARLLHADRRENSAEHSWHLAMLALILAEYSDQPVDVAQAIQLVLIHDVVEIDAGDTFAYDLAGHADQADREQRAAARIFGLLPADQAAQLWARWQEFEAGQTAEARFARAVDRLMPPLHNYAGGGPVWRQHGITVDQVRAKNAVIADSSAALGQAAQALIAEAVAQGFLTTGDDTIGVQHEGDHAPGISWSRDA